MKQCPICMTEFSDDYTSCPNDGARLMESREWKPGTMVRNKYRVVAKLGQGGMGSVYKAVHIALEEVRALKVMDPQLAGDPKFVIRFRHEAQVARRLRHQNAVHVDDLDQAEDGSLFIAMEFVDGVSLRQLLKATRGPLPLARALAITRGIAEALSAAHALGMVHRDIKPDNILLARDSQGRDVPKVLDFGIVAMKEGSAILSSRPLMTPAYAPPEQWAGMKGSELDGRADLYALGMTLYEMLTGRLPFAAETNEGWMRAHLEQPPQPPSRLNPELAGQHGVDAVVMKLLAKNRDQRHADAHELLSDLNLLEAQYAWGKETVVVRPQTPPSGYTPPAYTPPVYTPPPSTPPLATPPSLTPPSYAPTPQPGQPRTPAPPQQAVMTPPPSTPVPGPPAPPQPPYISPYAVAPPPAPPQRPRAEEEPPPLRPPQPPGQRQFGGFQPQVPRREEEGAWKKWVVGIVALLVVGGGLAWWFLRTKPPEIASFKASPAAIEKGQSARLEWGANHVTKVRIEPGVGEYDYKADEFAMSGINVAPKEDTTYRMVATGPGGTVERTVSITVKPFAISSVLFSDDFKGARHWLEGNSAKCSGSYKDDGYTLTDISKGEQCHVGPASSAGVGSLDASVRIETSVKLLSGKQDADFGLKFGAQPRPGSDVGNFYTFGITANGGYQLFHLVNNKWSKLFDPEKTQYPTDPAIKTGTGETNRIAVEIRGRSLTFFVNNKRVRSYEAATEVRGGFGIYLDQPGQAAVFSDLQITKLL